MKKLIMIFPYGGYPEDEDWECTCRGQDDPCEHVAAAVIALRRARKAGESLPRPAGAAARIRYGFHSRGTRSVSAVRRRGSSRFWPTCPS